MTSRNERSENPPTFLSIAAVRRELGDISRATVYRMFDSGTLSRTTVGRRVLVPRADVEALLGGHSGGEGCGPSQGRPRS